MRLVFYLHRHITATTIPPPPPHPPLPSPPLSHLYCGHHHPTSTVAIITIIVAYIWLTHQKERERKRKNKQWERAWLKSYAYFFRKFHPIGSLDSLQIELQASTLGDEQANTAFFCVIWWRMFTRLMMSKFGSL